MVIYCIHNKHYNNTNKTTNTISTGCTLVNNIQHLHDKTMILPLLTYLELYTSQFNNCKYTTHIETHKNLTFAHIKQNIKCIHTTTVTTYLITMEINKLIQLISKSLFIPYLDKVDASHYPSSLCPLCKTQVNTTTHMCAYS